MNPLQETLRRACTNFGTQAPTLYKAVIEKGKGFDSFANHDLELMTAKECFSNAITISIEHGLTYVEGFVMSEQLSIPIHHAWCVDLNDDIVEITLRLRPGDTYWYAGIEVEYPLQWLQKHYGIFEATDFIESLGYPSTKWIK